MKILCPISANCKDVPGHLLFGVNDFEQVSPSVLWSKCEIKKIYYTPYYGLVKQFGLILSLTLRILFTAHDVLYYGIDPNYLIMLAMLKKIGIYRKPMYAWKYIALHGKGYLKRWFYDAFNCIFMVTESHVDESVASGLIDADRCKYIKWGEDIKYVDALSKLEKQKEFICISTGKAYRDFDTLCQAFMGLDAVRLKIFVCKKWGMIDYQSILSKYNAPNIEVYFMEDITLHEYKTKLDYLFAEMKAADCALVICGQVNFGVGFTAMLDSMVSCLPVITTYNKDNPIDVECEGIGYTVQPGDVKSLREKVLYLFDHTTIAVNMGKKARNMVEQEYNIERTAKEVIAIIAEKMSYR